MLQRICGHCGRLVNQGATCSCGKNRHQEYDKHQRDKNRARFYKSRAWRLFAESVKARANGLDEYLLSKGQIVKGNVAHHIYTTEERPDLKLSLGNLIYVSSATHNMIHNEYDKGVEYRKKMQAELQAIRGQQKA